MLKMLIAILSITIYFGIPASPCFAEGYGATTGLGGALKDAKVSLEKGLSASQKNGKPISGKFELEDGKLQLSVYTQKGKTFSEVVVDHMTGKIEKTEEISKGDDLTAAKSQAEAMAKAKKSLAEAIHGALKGNAGYQAVSASSKLEDGHPVAEITLLKGEESKTVTEKLD
jgi:hypothetical protein